MSTAIIFRKGLCSLLNSAVIDILAKSTGTDKALDLLKANFTFTTAEIAANFQDSHARALAAISAGLVSPEQGRGFWQKVLESRIEQEFSQRIEQDYLLPFAQQQNLSTEALSKFRQTALEQCKRLAKCTLFQADNVPFTESDLASFVTETGTFAITDLVLAQVSIPLDDSVRDFLSYNELLGQSILFFLHENLRNDTRMSRTLEALQREGLILDVREIKSLVQSSKAQLKQAYDSQQFCKLAVLGPKLDNLQKIESVTESHYALFFAFKDDFASWRNLLSVELSDIFTAMDNLQLQLGDIKKGVDETKGIAEQILAIVEQLMSRADLSPQMKPRDEFTQYSSASLDLINQALRLSKNLPPSDAQFSRVAIALGSVVSASGDLKNAGALLSKAYKQARNDEERALSVFNFFQLLLRSQAYDKALLALKKAIKFNPQRYALHDVHKYPIERILGAGGMGCVFLCRVRLKKNKKVVVKCFWETLKGSLDEIFQEPLLMAEIAGEYVPAPLDYGFVDTAKQERGFFVTEYCDGAVDGEAWLKAHGNLDVNSGIAVGLQIARALQLAHEKGIFHLDLKPANLLFSPVLSSPSVKVIDFGLAKVAKSLKQEMRLKQSKTGLSVLAQSVFGTFDYAPPEQQGYGGEPGAKSDVYAFGKTLYRLLTGEIPHTLHPRRLASAPELFELLCDCVVRETEKRPDVGTLISRLNTFSHMQKDVIDVQVEAYLSLQNDTISDIPSDVLKKIKEKSEKEYPDDFQMQKYVIDKQVEAYFSLQNDTISDIPSDVLKKIKEKSEKEYPDDFQMQKYVIDKQVEAYFSLQNDTISDIPSDVLKKIKEKSEKEYPDDSHMQKDVIDAQVEPYLSLQNDTISDIPSDVLKKIKRQSEKDYPADYEMQKSVIDDQVEAYLTLQNDTISDIPSDVLKKIKRQSEKDYPADYEMQKSVIDDQVEAYLTLQK